MNIDLEKFIEHLDTLSEAEAIEAINELMEDEEVELDEESKSILEQYVENKNMTEATTPAADTLRPGGAPGDSKAQTMAAFNQLMAQLGKEDLSNLFNQVQAQFGPNSIPGAVDNSAKNKSTHDMKPSSAVGKGAWKEDLDNLFSGDDLTEEQKEQTSVIFEAAVASHVALVEADLQEQFEGAVEALEEEYAQRLEEETAEIFETIAEKLDQYLDHVIESWMEENEVAIESSLRVEVAENFIGSLKDLFTEHYIKVPETKLDIVADLAAELEEVKEQLNVVLDEKLQLESVVEQHTKESILSESTEGLTDIEADRLINLAEGLEFTDVESFKRKVNILKEKCVGTRPQSNSGLITEDLIDDDSNEIQDPSIEAVARAISLRNRF